MFEPDTLLPEQYFTLLGRNPYRVRNDFCSLC